MRITSLQLKQVGVSVLRIRHSYSTDVQITSQWSGTGNENFWKWNGKFRSDRTNQSKRTTSGGGHFSGKFPPGPKRSIYVSTEICGKFGIMEGNLSLRRELNAWPSSSVHRSDVLATELVREGPVPSQVIFTGVTLTFLSLALLQVKGLMDSPRDLLYWQIVQDIKHLTW